MALVVARVLSPRSKLSTTTALNAETAKHTLAEELAIGDVDVHELYAAMDWLATRQTRIENKLAKKHLKDGQLVLFDVSSSYYTGRKSPLIKHGYSRDHRGDRPQIVYGLLCDSEGRPIAIEVFRATRPTRRRTQIVATARKRFGINRLVFVGDRGMITSARINEDLRGVDGLDWISALRTEGIRKLWRSRHDPDVSVRHTGFGRGDIGIFSRRATGCLSQSGARRATCSQAKRVA